MTSKAASERNLRTLLTVIAPGTGNDLCCDCRDRATWASWHPHGITLCERCAGLHRRMGSHISKVKSCVFAAR